MKTFLVALKYRPFALLWGGQTISGLGDHIFRIGLAWWVLEKTGSAAAMASMMICSTIPMLLFSLLGGVLVDRFPRLSLMLLSDALRGILVGWMAMLSARDWLEIWHVLIVSALFGCVDAIFQPAYRAILPELLSSDKLIAANSISSLSSEASGLIGPSLGAAAVAFGSCTTAFALNALSFLLSAACLWPIVELSSQPVARDHQPGILEEARFGLRTVFSTPWLWITIAIAGISNVTYAGPMGVALPFLIRDHLHADVQLLGYFYSAMSLGAVAGAIGLSQFQILHHRGITLYAVWMIIGLMVAAMALPAPPYLMLGAAALIGAANAILGLVWLNTLQELVPRELQGRVSSIDFLGSSALEPVGYGIGGWATSVFGPVAVFAVGGILQTGLIALGLLHPRVRNLD